VLTSFFLSPEDQCTNNLRHPFQFLAYPACSIFVSPSFFLSSVSGHIIASLVSGKAPAVKSQDVGIRQDDIDYSTVPELKQNWSPSSIVMKKGFEK